MEGEKIWTKINGNVSPISNLSIHGNDFNYDAVWYTSSTLKALDVNNKRQYFWTTLTHIYYCIPKYCLPVFLIGNNYQNMMSYIKQYTFTKFNYRFINYITEVICPAAQFSLIKIFNCRNYYLDAYLACIFYRLNMWHIFHILLLVFILTFNCT